MEDETLFKPPQGARADAIRAELARILSSSLFRESRSLCALLRFVVEESLAGRPDGIKESIIGRLVFHRGEGFDPRYDSIVRVQASSLRKRLAAFYGEVPASSVQIDLPTGCYVPVFKFADLSPKPLTPARRTTTLAFALALVVIVLLAAATAHIAQIKPRNLIWKPLLQGSEPVFVVLGSPALFSIGNVILRDLNVNSPGDLRADSDVAKLSVALGNGGRLTIADPHYTGVGEAAGLERLSRYFHDYKKQLEVRFTGIVTREELASSSLIVISTLRFNTLLQQLDLPSVFSFHVDAEEVILNKEPLPGEPSEFRVIRKDPARVEYALIGIWPGSKQGTRIIQISGTSTWATQAAVDFLTGPESSSQIGQQIEPGRPVQSVLRVQFRGLQLVRTELVALHHIGAKTKSLAQSK